MYARFSFVDNSIDDESCDAHINVYIAMPKHECNDKYLQALSDAETRLFDMGYDVENVSGGFIDASDLSVSEIAQLEAGEIVVVNL